MLKTIPSYQKNVSKVAIRLAKKFAKRGDDIIIYGRPLFFVEWNSAIYYIWKDKYLRLKSSKKEYTEIFDFVILTDRKELFYCTPKSEIESPIIEEWDLDSLKYNVYREDFDIVKHWLLPRYDYPGPLEDGYTDVLYKSLFNSNQYHKGYLYTNVWQRYIRYPNWICYSALLKDNEIFGMTYGNYFSEEGLPIKVNYISMFWISETLRRKHDVYNVTLL